MAIESKTKLLPCPFCGHEGTLRAMRFGMEKEFRWAVTCTVCQIAIGWEFSEEQAVNRWNTRVERNPHDPDGDIKCVMCGDTFTEDGLKELDDMGERYHREDGCFLCPDCWNRFRRLDPEEQARIAITNGWKVTPREG